PASSKRDTVLRSIPSFRAMADFERPLANNSRTCNTSSPLYIPSPPLGRVWRRRSSEVGIFHSGDFAEYVSGGFVHFSSGDDICGFRALWASSPGVVSLQAPSAQRESAEGKGRQALAPPHPPGFAANASGRPPARPGAPQASDRKSVV